LQYRVRWPARVPADLDRWVSVDLSDEIRSLAREGGIDVDTEGEFDGGALFGTAGRLFELEGSVGFPLPGPYAATGAAWECGSVALRVSTGPAQERLLAVLDAASSHRSDVRAPFAVLASPGVQKPRSGRPRATR
jgi:hypothetical protein